MPHRSVRREAWRRLDFALRATPLLVVVIGMLLAVGVAWLDSVTGTEISLSFFYVLPVCFVAWYAGRRPGLFLAFFASGAWFASRVGEEPSGSGLAIPFWNASLELAIFLTIAVSLDALRRAFDDLRAVANVDALTGIPNRRAFVTRLELEARREARPPEPLTLLYIDLDGFKAVNDASGHQAGDDVLRAVATTMRAALRSTDVTARLGGDEFAALLPDTHADAARHVVGKLRDELGSAMRERQVPVTFSIGAVTFVGPLPAVDKMLREADAEMYAVKTAGKNAVRMKTLAG